jgi:hypothetical protein
MFYERLCMGRFRRHCPNRLIPFLLRYSYSVLFFCYFVDLCLVMAILYRAVLEVSKHSYTNAIKLSGFITRGFLFIEVV